MSRCSPRASVVPAGKRMAPTRLHAPRSSLSQRPLPLMSAVVEPALASSIQSLPLAEISLIATPVGALPPVELLLPALVPVVVALVPVAVLLAPPPPPVVVVVVPALPPAPAPVVEAV